MQRILPYNLAWPSEFQRIAADLRRGLGRLALRIDHIGSTSVPNLDAKDLIDIQITVAELSDEVASKIKSLGLIQQEGIWRDHCPPGAPEAEEEWRKLLFIQPLDKRRINLRVRVQGRANQRYPLLFRDYLRAHPKTAAAYA